LIELSIILVHYRTPELLTSCLQSVYTHSGNLTIEVIVIENSPEWDELVTLRNAFPQVQWIRADYNLGFARANNLGLTHARGTYFLMLNPDARVSANTFTTLIETYRKVSQHKAVGLVTCRIRSSVDGSLLVGSGNGYPDLKRIWRQHPLWIRLFRSFSRPATYVPDLMHYKTHEVDFASGAVLLGKLELARDSECRLDEDFFLYYEDMEWCARLKEKGFHHVFCGETEILHVNAASTSEFSNRNLQIYVSELLYYYKQYSTTKFLIYQWVVQSTIRWDYFLAKNKEEKLRISEKKAVFSHYVSLIRKTYQRRVSSGNEYLRYDQEVLSK